MVSTPPTRSPSPKQYDAYLPDIDLTATGEPGRAKRDLRGHGQTVLLVEDEPALRQVCRRLLAGNGYRVLTPDDSTAALDLARQQPTDGTDLLLTDVVMPHLLGTALAEQVPTLHPGPGCCSCPATPPPCWPSTAPPTRTSPCWKKTVHRRGTDHRRASRPARRPAGRPGAHPLRHLSAPRDRSPAIPHLVV
jgi:CheY-like chemotaxis protein